MSRRIVDRVWQHSKLSGANKLLLLALAEQADDDGFTWIGYKTLAPMVGVIERQVYRLVDNLIKKGELLVWEQQGQHGGRGYTNIYFVTAGLSQEQIADVTRIRFDLVPDEIEAVINKKGDIYIKLCDIKRIAPATLERTRKSGGYVTLEDERGSKKPDTSVTHNNDNSDLSVTQKDEPKPTEEQKPDTSVTRLLDSSLNPGINPSIESKRESRARFLKPKDILEQHKELALKLISICGYANPKYVVNGKLKECSEAIQQLADWEATLDLLDEFREPYWWGDSPPTFKQVVEYWGKFLEQRHKPRKQKDNGIHQTKRPHVPPDPTNPPAGIDLTTWQKLERKPSG